MSQESGPLSVSGRCSKYVTSLNNTVIVINDTNYTLQGVANFSRVWNLTITGKGLSLTHVYCNNTNPPGAGIVFEKSRKISLSDFTINNCGILNKSIIIATSEECLEY